MIPLVDLRAQHESLKAELASAIAGVVETSSFILGENVRRFEQEFADFVGARYAVGVNSGTDALALALAAAGIGPGDEVIVPVNTFIATALAVSMCGAVPRFVDVEPQTLNIDPEKVAAAITPKTKAVLPVHLYGQPADMHAIMEIAAREGLVVIEDACQAHGAQLDGRGAGTFGRAACFSFYPSKNLGAWGDAGMVVTNDEELRDRLLLARDYGQRTKYHHLFKGRNSRLDEIQAAVLRVKLRHLDEWNERRWRVAEMYLERLKGLPVELPAARPGVTRHAWYVFVIQVEKREELAQFLKDRGIQTGIHFPIPIHLQPAYAELGGRPGDFPVAERAARRVLSLPMYPEMTAETVGEVVQAVEDFFRKAR